MAGCDEERHIVRVRGKGWRSARPLLTWLGGFLLFALANAHTHVPGKILVISMIVLGYLFLGTALVVYLVKRLRYRDPPDAG